jgi:hypothetical protein
MELHIVTYTFKADNVWETVDTCWHSPFFYWQKNGVRVTPPVPLRIVVWGSVVDESDEGWINVGGASAMLMQRVQARGLEGPDDPRRGRRGDLRAIRRLATV